jgi:branched-chain amino acid transport system substrate-binding protein
VNLRTRVLVGVSALLAAVLPATALSGAGRLAVATPLPSSSCGPVVYEGAGQPDYIVASDLPMQGASRPQTEQMTQAVTYVLRQRGFAAGAYKIGYQVCDDSTALAGSWDAAYCDANAKSYAANPTVIGIIGTFNSGCARIVLPTINAAAAGPLPIVSPANTYDGLTRTGPETEPGEPGKYYPTGVRNYLRVTAPRRVPGRGQREVDPAAR